MPEVVQSARSRLEQSARIDAYWDLCSSIADYYLGLREADELSRLRGRMGSAAVGDALQQADRELAIRGGTAMRAARSAQYRLAGLMGSPSLPLPGDPPHCGRYDTKLAQVFPDGAPAEAAELHALLPLRHAELAAAADNISRADRWVEQVARQPTHTGDGVLRALELLAFNRRAFVQLARDYNRRIARYAELSRPGRIDSGRLVAMLVETPGAKLAVAPGGVTFRAPR